MNYGALTFSCIETALEAGFLNVRIVIERVRPGDWYAAGHHHGALFGHDTLGVVDLQRLRTRWAERI